MLQAPFGSLKYVRTLTECDTGAEMLASAGAIRDGSKLGGSEELFKIGRRRCMYDRPHDRTWNELQGAAQATRAFTTAWRDVKVTHVA